MILPYNTSSMGQQAILNYLGETNMSMINETKSSFPAFLWLLFIGGGLLLLLDGGIINTPSPFTTDKLTVLFVGETEQEQNLTPGQRDALHSTKAGSVWDYITNTAKGQFHNLDKDQDMTQEDPVWQQAMAACKKQFYDETTKTWKTLPVICISNGKSGYVGPCPAEGVDILNLIKKYGGASSAKASAIYTRNQRHELSFIWAEQGCAA